MAYDRPDRRIYGFAHMTRCWLGARLWPVIRYVDRNSISSSQFLNTLLGGEPHETLSSRIYRCTVDDVTCSRIALLASYALECVERDHCKRAYLRAHMRAKIMRIERPSIVSRLNPP